MVAKSVIALGVLLLAGCNSAQQDLQETSQSLELPKSASEVQAEPERVAKSVDKPKVIVDKTYLEACRSLKYDEQRYTACVDSPESRAQIAEKLAQTTASIVMDMASLYGDTPLSINKAVADKANVLPLTRLPLDLVGLDPKELELPRYFEVEGALFGYLSPVGLNAVVASDAYETIVNVGKLTVEQQEFVERICLPVNYGEEPRCEGSIYLSLDGEDTADLYVLGAYLKPITEERIARIELKRLW